MEVGKQSSAHEKSGGLETSRLAMQVIDSIDGNEIENQLIELAKIGGTRIEPAYGQNERYATNRLALSAQDKEARRNFVIPKMLEAGADIYDEHPLGVMATLPGNNPDLPPVVMMSHADTVKGGGMYDGTLGSVGAIEILKAINESGAQLDRSVGAFVLTGEESAPFDIALFGSKGAFFGLDANDLAMSNNSGISIAEALGDKAVDIVKTPLFGPEGMLPSPGAVIELHVEQAKSLEKTNANGDYAADIGVVHSIAAPERYIATVGDEPLAPDTRYYPNAEYMKLTVAGKADHSGATPIETSERADGFLAASSYLQRALIRHGHNIAIGEISAKDQGISKIPGATKAMLRINGGSDKEIAGTIEGLRKLIDEENQKINSIKNNFDADPISISRISAKEAGTFFNPEEMRQRQHAALRFIESVNKAALANKGDHVVGTVGSFETTDEGKIRLKVDIRGINEASRSDTVSRVHASAKALSTLAKISMGDVLAGSGDSPVQLDDNLVQTALDVINQYEIAKTVPMFSAAGHDTQNAARAGVPSVMLFCRSQGGISHDPLEYTSPQDLEKGVRSMAALVLKLAS